VGVLLDTRDINFYDDKYKNLKVISRVGVGMDNVDIEGAKERGIKVYGTPVDELTQSVAEFTVCQILKFFRHHRRILRYNSVGIIGYGRIGGRIEYLLSPFVTANFYIYDKKYYKDAGISTKEVVLKNSDIIIIAVSGNEEIIGKKELDMIKDGAVLVNIARKECVDENEVINALRENLFGFISDVNTPYYLSDDRILITPHIASDTRECRKAMELMAVENLEKGLK
jgi:D-3-phosphoglycerate dehydrogenase